MTTLVCVLALLAGCYTSAATAPSATATTVPTRPPPKHDNARPAASSRSFVVYKADRKVLTIWDHPGPLISTALPPPGFKPPVHPFLTGTAHDAASESELRKLLEQSTSFDDFVDHLSAAGFRLEVGE